VNEGGDIVNPEEVESDTVFSTLEVANVLFRKTG
jgi:hypothetical protein